MSWVDIEDLIHQQLNPPPKYIGIQNRHQPGEKSTQRDKDIQIDKKPYLPRKKWYQQTINIKLSLSLLIPKASTKFLSIPLETKKHKHGDIGSPCLMFLDA